MTPTERIEYMLKAESTRPQKDAAGIYIPSGVDAAIKAKTLQEVLNIIRRKD